MKKCIIITAIVTAIITVIVVLSILNIQNNNEIEDSVSKIEEKVSEAEKVNNKVENVIVDSEENEIKNEIEENILPEKEIEKETENNVEDTVKNEIEKEEVIEEIIEEPQVEYIQGYEVVGYIKIPKYDVNAPIFRSVIPGTLNISVGLAYGSLNEVGNAVMMGHGYKDYPFEKISQLENGDRIIIVDATKKEVTYEVYDKQAIDGNDASYMIKDTNGAKEITMQTGHSDPTKRLIVSAKEINN